MKIQKTNDNVIMTFSKEEFTLFREGAKLAIEELDLLSKGDVMTEVDQTIAATALDKLNSVKVEVNLTAIM